MPIAFLLKMLPWLIIFGDVGSMFAEPRRKKRKKSRVDTYEFFD